MVIASPGGECYNGRHETPMFGSIGPTELILIFVIALLVFGPKKLPEIGRSVGKALREFKKTSEEIKGRIEEEIEASEIKDIRKDIQSGVDDIKSGIKSFQDDVKKDTGTHETGEGPKVT
jgi:TatA/E family protein of Tat protein translocase